MVAQLLRGPRTLRTPPLSDTRWLAQVKRKFDGEIAKGKRHPVYGSHIVSVGAGLPGDSTYDVVRAVARGTEFMMKQAGYPKVPTGLSQWARFATNPAAVLQQTAEANTRLSQMFNYGSTDGLPIVRESFAKLSARDWGYNFDPDLVFPSSGGTTSLIDSLVKSFEVLDQPFAVFVSRPAYTGTVARLALARNIRVYSVPVDAHGMIPDALKDRIARARKDGLQPAFVLDVPLGHNPLGITYTAERIQQVYDVIASDPSLFFVEDDPYGAFIYGDQTTPPATFTAIDTENRVALFRTCSKTGIPAFRAGFGYLPVKFFVEGEKDPISLKSMMMAAGGMGYLIPSNLDHIFTVAQWYEDDLETMGSLWPEARVRTKHYGANRDALLHSLNANFGDLRGSVVDWNDPTSGFFLRFTLNQRPINPENGQPMTSRQVVEWLLENEFLITTPMSGFYPADAKEEEPEIGENELRICFSYGTPEDMAEAGYRLAHGLKQLLGIQ